MSRVKQRLSDHSQKTPMTTVQSFAPIIGEKPRVLILGSMPGVASLQAHRYYAHPRNAFWPIVLKLLAGADLDHYEQRLQLLKQKQVALWDVLASCQRAGSLDSAIATRSVIANPIAALLQSHPSIQAIALNGNSAHQLFVRHCLPLINRDAVVILPMPSTSPANAGMTTQQKYQRWAELARYLR